MPKAVMRDGIEQMKAAGKEVPFDVVDIDQFTFLVDDDVITTAVDGSKYLDNKGAAMKAYPTQINSEDEFFALSNNIGQSIMSVEHYELVRGVKGPVGDDGREDSLFAGVE
jgi:N-acetyl-1-D-myo-inositol-2-amino-2-deoxy-alpha-D-glucopyranoside deacetylase